MITADDVVRAIAILCWGVVILRGVRARRLDETWWACLLLAVTTTVTIASNAQLLADLTGIGALATLLADVTAVLAAAVLVRGLAHASVRADHRPVPAAAVVGGTAVAVVGLVATWLSAPHSASTSATHPAVALHWLLLHTALLAAVSVIGLAKLREVRVLPLSSVRSATVLLLFAAACLGLASALGVLTQVAALTGTEPAGPLPHLTLLLQSAFVVLFLVGVTMPLLRPAHSGGVVDEVAALADWLGCPRVEAPSEGLFPVLVEIRDRMWELQQHLDRAQVAAAAVHARRLRLSGTSARAFTAAVCLQIGLSAEAADPDGRATDPADLSRLGGGRTPAEEARWLAAITRARRVRDVSGAARRIAARTPAEPAVER
ncbi:DUF6545 domain-containing protein [Pseudonocardia sp. CA-107938]|uniref:DUF6545 domain-containing protein n=1 Tax=Pseudonocardia sp. CA-107938 TaxID=3240021 RepID=UPI003D8B20F4